MFESYDKTKVQRVETEEPEKKPELIFDPERDITEDDWKNIREFLERFKGSRGGKGDWYSFLMLARYMKELGYNGDLGLDDRAWEGIEKLKNNALADQRWDLAVEYLTAMIRIGYQGDTRMSSEMREGLINMLSIKDYPEHYLKLAASIKQLEPTFPIEIPNDIWKRIKPGLEKWSGHDEELFASLAKDIALLGYKEDLTISERGWKRLIQRLEISKDMHAWGAFAKLAALMFAFEKISQPKSPARQDNPIPPPSPIRKF